MDAPTRLSNWPWVEVRVDCRLCPRHGRYRLARLAHAFGSEMDLDNLLNHLAADCPWRRLNPRKYEPRCGARFTDWDRARPTLDKPRLNRNTPSSAIRVLTLADHPGPMVTIICLPCRRRGVLSVARLIARLGADTPLPSVLSHVAGDCPGRREATPRCQAVYERPIGER